MKSVIAIFWKDFKANTWTFPSFLVFAIFALLSGFFFFANVVDYHILSSQASIHPGMLDSGFPSFAQAVIAPFLINAALVLLIVVPIVTMRSFAEEKKTGTLELLFTYPASDFEIVAGKFLAVALHLFIFFLPAIFNFIFLYKVQYHFEISLLCVAFAGLFLITLAFASIGLLVSSLTDSPAFSAVLTFALLALWWSVGLLTHIFLKDPVWVKEIWLIEHLRSFARGIVELRQVVFYLLVIMFFFFLTLLSVESRSWKRGS